VATVVEAHTHPPFGYRMNQLRSQGSPKRWSLVLSKQRRHDGPRGVKIIVTTLTEASAGVIRSIYAWRWGVEISQPYYDSRESLSLVAA
jgi:hypothetical protein